MLIIYQRRRLQKAFPAMHTPRKRQRVTEYPEGSSSNGDYSFEDSAIPQDRIRKHGFLKRVDQGIFDSLGWLEDTQLC